MAPCLLAPTFLCCGCGSDPHLLHLCLERQPDLQVHRRERQGWWLLAERVTQRLLFSARKSLFDNGLEQHHVQSMQHTCTFPSINQHDAKPCLVTLAHSLLLKDLQTHRPALREPHHCSINCIPHPIFITPLLLLASLCPHLDPLRIEQAGYHGGLIRQRHLLPLDGRQRVLRHPFLKHLTQWKGELVSVVAQRSQQQSAQGSSSARFTAE